MNNNNNVCDKLDFSKLLWTTSYRPFHQGDDNIIVVDVQISYVQWQPILAYIEVCGNKPQNCQKLFLL